MSDEEWVNDDTEMAGDDRAEQAESTDSMGSPAPAAPAFPNPAHVRLIQDPKLRFVLELEFVELLASPQYLQFLAQNRYLVDSAFLNYLSYLRYWHQPAYIKYLSHPHCLYFLDLLQSEAFRVALLQPDYVALLHEQQFYQWSSSRFNRFQEAKTKKELEDRKRIEAEEEKKNNPQ